MKKYIILSFSLCSLLLCMETPTQYEIQEWDAQAYHKGCQFQTDAFFKFFNLPTNKKNILDMGCGIANISKKIAENAQSIHCVDASKNMIEFAQNNTPNHITNMSFQQSLAETFTSDKKYQLGIMSFCFHWFHNQEEALKRMYDALEENGELFMTAHTQETPEPTSIPAARQTINLADSMYKFFTNKSFIELSGSQFPSNDTLKTMLLNIGFTIIKQEQQSFECIMTEQEIRNTEWPIVSSRPMIKWIPKSIVSSFFEAYIHNYLALTPKTNDGKFIEKLTSTIIHARKITNK